MKASCKLPGHNIQLNSRGLWYGALNLPEKSICLRTISVRPSKRTVRIVVILLRDRKHAIANEASWLIECFNGRDCVSVGRVYDKVVDENLECLPRSIDIDLACMPSYRSFSA